MVKKTNPIDRCYHVFKKPSFYVLVFLLQIVTACNKEVNKSRPFINPPASPTGLNIILILGDDIGYEMLSCNGGQSYSTPNLDMMARQGIRFTQCHSSPLCSPSRFMLLTGKYNFRNYTQWGVMSPSEKTIGNMFQDAGYQTCVSGKWQFDGGDASIKAFGFDKYCIVFPFKAEEHSRYKNPAIYEAGSYLPDNLIVNKYGEDFFTDYVNNFMDSATKKQAPFFIYYPMVLCHAPFSPTPDNSEFGKWNPDKDGGDKHFFPSMAEYMDKKIGQVIEKVKSLGIEKNTVIIYTGDNGTPTSITSRFNGMNIEGGKGKTIEYGTHVPLIAYCPALIPGGITNDDLISFPDFLQTLANIAGLKVPEYFGATDGISFYSGLAGGAGNSRNWIFCHFDPYQYEYDKLSRWVQNKNYKLYDFNERFFNIQNDIMEVNPIPVSSLTPDELIYKNQFQKILDSLK